MYADDLVILSNSGSDLRKSINTLNKHAKLWKLKINTSKTNIMIFNKLGKTIETQTFHCDKHPINVVDKQVYLGLTLTPSGRFTCAREILVKKGNKILASVRRMLSNCDYIPTQVYCKLFDTVIKPALLYGNEIWGPELF